MNIFLCFGDVASNGSLHWMDEVNKLITRVGTHNCVCVTHNCK